MEKSIRYVGLDVHKMRISIAYADEGDIEPVNHATVPNQFEILLKQLKRLGSEKDLMCCYEAGPTGYVLYRKLKEVGIQCKVVAPSLVPDKKGDRVKTDKRDAVKLARYLRSGDLTPVYVPDETCEAIRDLVRARADVKKAEQVARNQLFHFLLRHGRIYDGGYPWTQKHKEWMRTQKFEHEAQQRVLVECLKSVEAAGEKIERFNDDIADLVKGWSLYPQVKALQALRGVSLVSAAVIVSELGELNRFEKPTLLMSYLGLVPSEYSSGESRWQGRITRTGNSIVRKTLVEAAWSYRFSPHKSQELKKRSEGVSTEVQEIAWKAQLRLHKKYRKLLARGKNLQKVMTAVARELAGFIWAISKQPKLLAG